MIPDEVGKGAGMWPGPRCGRHRPGCGLRGSRLDDLAAERRRLGTPERRVDAPGKRGCVVHSWNAEFAKSEEVDDGLRKARVRVPLRLVRRLSHDRQPGGDAAVTCCVRSPPPRIRSHEARNRLPAEPAPDYKRLRAGL